MRKTDKIMQWWNSQPKKSKKCNRKERREKRRERNEARTLMRQEGEMINIIVAQEEEVWKYKNE